MPDYRIHSLVKLLGDLWQGIEDANEIVPNARESGNVQVQQAVSFKGDVRLVDPGMLVSTSSQRVSYCIPIAETNDKIS